MADHLKKYRVTVPVDYISHAIGHLSSIGGWVDELDEAVAGRQVVWVRLPAHIDPADVRDVLARSSGATSPLSVARWPMMQIPNSLRVARYPLADVSAIGRETTPSRPRR